MPSTTAERYRRRPTSARRALYTAFPLVRPCLAAVLCCACSARPRPAEEPDASTDTGTETDTGDGWGSAPGWEITWVVQAGGEISPDDWGDFSFDVEAASPDEVYITGRVVSEVAVFGLDTENQIDLHEPEIPAIFLARYDGEGVPAWVATVTDDDYEGYDVDIAPDGSVLMAGRVHGGSPVFGAGEAGEVELDLSCDGCPFLASWSADGTFQWVAAADGAGGDDEGYGLAYSVSSLADGSSYVAGELSEPLVLGAGTGGETVLDVEGSSDGWVARFGPAGEVLWARRVFGESLDKMHSVAARPDGSCVATGYYRGAAEIDCGGGDSQAVSTQGEWGAFAASWDQDGSFSWITDLGIQVDDGPAPLLWSVAARSDGGAFIGGGYSGTIRAGAAGSPNFVTTAEGARDIFLTRLDAYGEWLWTSVAAGGGDSCNFDRILDIAIVSDGDVLVGGVFAGEKMFGPGEPGETVLAEAAGSHYDGFVALYHEDGTLAWALRFASGPDDYPDPFYFDSVQGVAAAGESTIFATGFFYGTVTFGTGPDDAVELTAFGDHDIFLARLDRTDGPG